MNSRALSDKAKYLANKHNVTANLIINHYFFDAILRRISRSIYHKQFILKGGYLLSIHLGIATRTTNDLDFLLKKHYSDDNAFLRIVQNILNIDVNDSIKFEIIGIDEIQDGLAKRVKLLSKLERIRQPINIDIAKPEPIHPNVKLMNYTSIVNEDEMKIRAYPFETVLAEKLQTVVSLGLASSRAKDLFDLFIISKRSFNDLDLHNILIAIEKTFKHRGTYYNHAFIVNVLLSITNSVLQQNLWRNYERKHYFAKGITHSSLIGSIIEMINKIFD